MKPKSTKLIIGLLSIITLFSCEKETIDNTYSSVKIKKKITITEQAIDTTTFEYSNDNLLMKMNHSGNIYNTLEYDESDRIVKSNSFNSSGLYHYFVFQYNSTFISRMRFQYYPYQGTWGGDNEKTVYSYNSENYCERIEYYNKNNSGDWVKSEYYSICTWTNENLTEFKHFNGDNLEYTETYQYDDKLNPEKLLNYLISPWTKSKNNMIGSSTKYTDGRQTSATYEYLYNGYGYPTEKIRIDDVGSLTEKYEYKFE